MYEFKLRVVFKKIFFSKGLILKHNIMYVIDLLNK